MDDTNPTPPNTTPEGEPPPAIQKMVLTVERVLEILSKGRIMGEAQGRLRWSSNYTFLVGVCEDDYEIRAIYKPRQGERPLWDFPDGTLCLRERAAFLVSEALGWRIVPPTVLHEGPRGMGSLQLYIEHNPEVTYFNLGEAFTSQLQRIAAFDYITNNADRKGGHCLLGNNNKVWGIDHGICFHVAPKLRTVIWEYASLPLPEDIRVELQTFQEKLADQAGELNCALLELLSSQEIDAVRGRVRRLLKSSKFPDPGYGPSYPWPPV